MVTISKRQRICADCGKKGRYGYWGRYYCRECFLKRFGKDPDSVVDSKGRGHSGMLPLSDEELKRALGQLFILGSGEDILLIRVPKGNKVFASLYLTHYPQSKGIVGRSLCYLIIYKNQLAGIIGVNSPPYSVEAVNKFFGITKENRDEKLRRILNNNIFRLIIREKNLGTRVLKVFRRRVKEDYEKIYGDLLEGLITFVEPPLSGAVYKADNWTYLGMTKGYGVLRRGERWFDKKWVEKTPKHIFAYKLQK